jgi:hypothetical protein
MRPDVIALHVVKTARLKRLAAICETIFEEGLVILARHEADLLTILLVGDLEAQLAGDAPDLLFGEGTEREKSSCELLPS